MSYGCWRKAALPSLSGRHLANPYVLLAFPLLGLLACPASAHSVIVDLHAVGDTKAIFHYISGEVMAGVDYQIYAPGNHGDPVLSGRTGADGGVVFHPVSDGRWSIQVKDDRGATGQTNIFVTKGIPSLYRGTLPGWAGIGSMALNLVLAFMLFTRSGEWNLTGRREVKQ